jgi:NADH-quinone oxidoreductase subunit M
MPWAGVCFIIGGLVSMGMPGFSGFIAEFPVFMGAWQTIPLVAIIAAVAIVVTAGYILLVVRRVFFGELPAEFANSVVDVSVLDKVTIGMLSVIMIGLGVFPILMVPLVQSGVSHLLALLGGG